MPDSITATTLVKLWTEAQQAFKAARLDSPAIDARLLLEAATGATRADILADPHRIIPLEQREIFATYIERRLTREPVARIIGRKGFWKLLLALDPHVLVPRPETECIVDMILKSTTQYQPLVMADLGVGSGAILLSVLAERPAARGIGTDISHEALSVARDNAANLGLGGQCSFLRTSWGQGLDNEQFDIIASNPPYIPSHVIDELEPEVRVHDPRLALDGGPSGLDAYEQLGPETMRLLKPGGTVYLEIGYDQSEAVESIMNQCGFEDVTTFLDLSNLPRVVRARRPL